MRDLSNLLWSDLETDQERLRFLESGRAWETGIVSSALEPDLILLVKARLALKDGLDLGLCGCLPNGARLEEWKSLVGV